MNGYVDMALKVVRFLLIWNSHMNYNDILFTSGANKYSTLPNRKWQRRITRRFLLLLSSVLWLIWRAKYLRVNGYVEVALMVEFFWVWNEGCAFMVRSRSGAIPPDRARTRARPSGMRLTHARAYASAH